jgi:hypothetical protein
MAIELNVGKNQFPEVIWVDADRRGDVVNLTFGSRTEGQGAALRVKLTLAQWKNLTFLVEAGMPGIPQPEMSQSTGS